MNPDSLPSTARRALREAAPVPASSLAAVHAAAEAAAKQRRAHRLRLRACRIAAAAACLAIAIGLLLRPGRTATQVAETDAGMQVCAAEDALELLLMEECGDDFDSSIASSEKLLLFQEYPGVLF